MIQKRTLLIHDHLDLFLETLYSLRMSRCQVIGFSNIIVKIVKLRGLGRTGVCSET